jgi:hypothetical protein
MKYQRKGIAKSLERLCEKFENAKRENGRDYGADPAKKGKRKASKLRRDPAVKRRAVRRPHVRTAVGPWSPYRDAGGDPAPKRKAAKKRKSAKRDPSWFGHPRLHAKAAKKGIRRAKRKASTGRDPAWFGQPRLHAKAAKKGIRRAKRRASTGRDPSWPGHKKAHSVAAKKGHRKAARKSGGKKHRSPAQIAATKRMLAGLKSKKGGSRGKKSKKGGMSYRDAMKGL